jgi:acyl-coenzyme A thioesterase PaaI-like protein
MTFFLQDNGDVISELVVPEAYAGYPGMVHGGNIVAMMDEAAGRAVTGDQPNRFTVTSQLTVKYRQPVPTNQLLKVTGRLLKKRGKVSHAYGEIRNLDGKLLAEADAVFVDVDEDFTHGADPDLLGWKVYTDD